MRLLPALLIVVLLAGCRPVAGPAASAVAAASAATPADATPLVVATPGDPVPPAPPAPPAPSAPAIPSPAPGVPPAPPSAAADQATIAPAIPCADPDTCRGVPRRVGGFDVDALPEASGLAASRRTPGLWYALDDGPGTTAVQVLAPDGGVLGSLAIAGLSGTDTEGLAVGACGPDTTASCIYVGDIGDNLGVRDHVDVWRVEEPDLAAGVPAEPLVPAIARLRYPDGPTNAEALLVDGAGAPLVVTKAPFDGATATTGPTRLLGAPAFTDATLTDLGEVPVPTPTIPLAAGSVGNVVTAGDAVPGRVLLRTYDAVVEYRAPDPAAPLSTFPTWPVTQLTGPFLPQAEAVAYTADGCGWATASEGIGDLWVATC